MQAYNKAIVAFITSIVGMLATLGLELPWASQEFIAGLSVLISTGLVFWIPNIKE